MAMNANTLGDAMKAAVDALTALQKQDAQTVYRALAGAIVAHIQGSATVTIKAVTDAGLQSLSGTPTSAPLTDKTLPAGCIQ